MRQRSIRPIVQARRSKLAVAQRKAHGLSVGEIARLERVSEMEVISTLGDAEVQRMAAALAALRERPRAERLQRLEAMALDILECRLLAGDPRVAAFIVWCQRRGLAPDTCLAEAMLRAAERQALASRPWHQGPLGRRLQEDPRPEPDAPLAPAPGEPATMVLLGEPQSPDAPDHPAAFGADPAAAALLIEREAAQAEARLQATRARLVRELAAEELRVASAPPAVPAFMESAADRRRASARRRARERKAQRAEAEALRLLSCGRPIDRFEEGARVALRHFAEAAAIEARMALMRLAGRPDSPMTQAAVKLHFWPRPPPFPFPR